MFNFNKRVLLIGPLGVVGAVGVLVLVAVVSGFTEDFRMASRFITGDDFHHSGLISLEETILGSDVIAVVEIESVTRGLEKHTMSRWTGYSKTLDFNYKVHEYLKGTGKDRIIGTVFHRGSLYNTAVGALLDQDPDKDRKTRWDDRRAIVFMDDERSKDPELNWREGRYWLAFTKENDEYSIVNPNYRPWLPAVSEEADEPTFLLESDLNRNATPDTITLQDMKALIVQLEQLTAGQTEDYQRCVAAQYRWNREVDHRNSEGAYPYIREDVTIESGAPSDTYILTSPIAPYVVLTRQDDPLPEGQEDQYVLVGRDAEYFEGTTPGHIWLRRPLPAGEYRTYHAHLPYDMGSLCGGTVPEVEMRRQELFVTVTAPEGTLHEAFFDPVEDGKAVAADDETGDLTPVSFTDATGAEAAIRRIAWEAEAGGVGTVTITLSPQSSIAGHTVEFIALDGSVPLSLAVADAQEDAANGTLSWKVASQPWQAGDKLMLRVSAAVS